MITERRQHHRKTFTELISVELGSHNSGLILNASEGGLAFHAGSPIQVREEIRFAITLDRSRTLEGSGRLEWTDGNATTAGLQFTEVSEEFRKEIRLWLAETDAPPDALDRPRADSEAASYFVAANMLRPASRVELPREEVPRENEQPPAEMQQPSAEQPSTQSLSSQQPSVQQQPSVASAQPPAAPKRKRKSKASHAAASSAAPSVDQPMAGGPAENARASSPVQPEEKTEP